MFARPPVLANYKMPIRNHSVTIKTHASVNMRLTFQFSVLAISIYFAICPIFTAQSVTE